MRYKRKPGKKTIQSKKSTYDGIKFASQLEVFMYKALKSADIDFEYEGEESFPLRWKLFKRLLHINNDNRVLYKPQSQSDCKIVIEDIIKRFYNG